jgi:hypothetical protein
MERPQSNFPGRGNSIDLLIFIWLYLTLSEKSKKPKQNSNILLFKRFHDFICQHPQGIKMKQKIFHMRAQGFILALLFPSTIALAEVGMGNHTYAAAANGGNISYAEGSFPRATGIRNVSSVDNLNSNGSTADAFSLQLNTNWFDVTSSGVCSGSGTCSGWAQFIYTHYNNDSAEIRVVYSVSGTGVDCLSLARNSFAGMYWAAMSGFGGINYSYSNNYCFGFGPSKTIPSPPGITELGSVKLRAQATADGYDSISLQHGSQSPYQVPPYQSPFGDLLSKNWRTAEFNVFGRDGSQPMAVFNEGAELTVKTTVYDGTLNAPGCKYGLGDGATMEMNNLYLFDTCSVTGGAEPSTTFAETSTPTYTVTAGQLGSGQVVDGGTISPPAVSVLPGKTASFTLTPDAGYQTSYVSGCGGTLSGHIVRTGAMTADCNVVVQFAQVQGASYTVTPSAGSGGTISPPTAVSVNSGATTAFTVTPASGYHINSISGCGGMAVNGNSSYTTARSYLTGAITGNCVVTATFTSVPVTSYTVTSTAGSGGTISPSGDSTVTSGAAEAFTITPHSGYTWYGVTGSCGTATPISANGHGGYSFTTQPVTANCTISATFAQSAVSNHTVTASAGNGGVINPSGTSTVASGASQIFTITPDSGYAWYGVMGSCGIATPIAANGHGGYTFTTQPVTADCTVSATFFPE